MDIGNQKTTGSSSCCSIGEEIIEEEILTRVPPDSLLRFRCISKSWRSLIDSKRFINRHLQISSRHRSRVITNLYDIPRFPYVKSSPFFLGDDKRSHCPIDTALWEMDGLKHPLGYGDLLGHCNGILCVFLYSEASFFLWNPATRFVAKLPDVRHDRHKKIKYGFGWDEESGAYKVFVSDSCDNGKGAARLYSSETNSWRYVEHGCESSSLVNEGFGVFACGKIHWLTRGGYIECFDLKNEVFETRMINIEQAFQVSRMGLLDWFWLWEWRGHLCLVCDTNFCTRRRVWVLNTNTSTNRKDEEFDWVEDEEASSELRNDIDYINGSHGVYTYIESLVSPPLAPNGFFSFSGCCSLYLNYLYYDSDLFDFDLMMYNL